MFSLVTRSSRVGAGRRGRAGDGALGTPREPQGDIRANMFKELGMLVTLIQEASSRIQWNFLTKLKKRTVRVSKTSSCFSPQPQNWEISSNFPGPELKWKFVPCYGASGYKRAWKPALVFRAEDGIKSLSAA